MTNKEKVWHLPHYANKRLKLIASYTQGPNVLDIGHAQLPNPHLSKFTTTGYDISPPTQRHDIYNREIQDDIQNIGQQLNNEKFDTIICAEFIEHLENPYAFLRQLKSYLSPNGQLIITTPNPFGFPASLFEILQLKTHFYTKDHTYLFPPRWVERILTNCQYQIKIKKGIGLWLPGNIVLPCPSIFSWQVIYIAQNE